MVRWQREADLRAEVAATVHWAAGEVVEAMVRELLLGVASVWLVEKAAASVSL